MSIPPQLIRVKRKASEDAPVSYLRVQENKRHQSGGSFIYQRQDKEIASAVANIPIQIQKPVIHTYPSDLPAFQKTKAQEPTDIPKENSQYDHGLSSPSTANNTGVGATSEPRRFHMSRKDMMLATPPHPPRGHGGVSKKRPAPALFIERKIKRISSRRTLDDKLHSAANAPTNHPTVPSPAPTSSTLTEAMEVDTPEPRKFKKPGVAKLAPKYKAELPRSLTQRWNVDMEKLTAEMDAYALEQIGLNLQKEVDETKKEEERVSLLKKTTALPLKFKPKAPPQRYAARHPESAHASVDTDMGYGDAAVSDSDDGDYIIETYVRVPVSKMSADVSPQNIGLLVFDEEPDIEFFYGEDDESEDEWAEDDEDENAENYYTADYPDEEVASDDELNQNPYTYRTGNASDMEEYDVDGDVDESPFDDDESSGGFKTYIGRNGTRTNHL
ncbi:hypothetical protein F4778DRAFT_782471 [Xylariomycetidae sp. FL2044]|nr:hypothetical protein F4778DRAFT_782471 [Xylariomycetidae sp. FL2044]